MTHRKVLSLEYCSIQQMLIGHGKARTWVTTIVEKFSFFVSKQVQAHLADYKAME